MNKTTVGARLKSERKKYQWSQSQLGRKIGMTQSRLSKIESDQAHPRSEEWERLRQCLDLPPLGGRVVKKSRPLPDSSWRAAKPKLRSAGGRPFEARLAAAKKIAPLSVKERLAKIDARADADDCHRFLRQAGLDSGLECLFWLQLLAVGGRPFWFAPAQAGRSLAMVQPDCQEIISDLRRPCIELTLPSIDCLLFPQVTLDARKAYYRLDVLACVRSGRNRCWLNIELDGQGHDPKFDGERERLLGLPTVRLSTSETVSSDLTTILVQRLTAWSARPPKAS